MKKKWFLTGSIMVVILAVGMAAFLLRRSPGKTGVCEELYVDNMGSFSTDEGFYYMDGDSFLQFYDYASNQNTPVCNIPNCEHRPWQEETPEEERCNAYIQGMQSLFVVQGELYVVQTRSEKNTLCITKSGLDRSRQSVLADLDCEYIGSYVIRGQSLYFASLKGEMEKDESGMPVQTGLSQVSLCSLALDSGKVRELETLEQHYNGQFSILGIYEGRIYGFYGYFEDKFTGENYEEAGRRLEWYTYDMVKGELDRSLEELSDLEVNRCLIEDGKLFYGKWEDRDSEKSDIYCYDLKTGENEKIIPDSFEIQKGDGKIFAAASSGDQRTVWDIESGDLSYIDKENAELSILAEYQDSFVAAKYENGTAVYGWIKKEEYYSGSGELIPWQTQERGEETEESLVWLIDQKELAEELQEPLNELLKEKGASYTVSIVGEETDWASEGAFTEMLQERRESDKATDLIYIPQMRSYGNDYATLVREDLLLPFTLEEGSVTEILGEFAVSSVEVDGKTYGLRGLHQYYNQGLKFNQYYLEKHRIPVESLSGNILENEELFREVAGMDEELQTPLAYWDLTEENLGYQFLFPSWTVGFFNEEGEEIVNVFAMEDTKEYLKSLKKFRDEGLISFLNIDGFKDVEVENGFFSITSSGTRPESYQTTTEGFYDKDGNMLRTDTLFVPGQADLGSLEVNPRGHVTGIASWSQKPEEAYAFLTLLFTDADVANLVKFGVEGSDYRLEGGRVTELLNPEQSPQANSFYINDALTYPMEEEPEDKRENWNQYFEKEGVHPLTGFQFDPSPVEEEIRAANAVLRSDTVNIDSYTKEFQDLMSGHVEDVDQALGELNEKLEAAGISKIIEEANRQLQEWKKTKGE